MKTGKLRQDDSYHWYLVPDDKIARFDEMSLTLENTDEFAEGYSDYEDEFMNRYSRYRLDGDPGIYKLSVIMSE